MRKIILWLFPLLGLLLFSCTTEEPSFSWAENTAVNLKPDGRLVGYEFYAKW